MKTETANPLKGLWIIQGEERVLDGAKEHYVRIPCDNAEQAEAVQSFLVEVRDGR